jgi:glycosyltransferase involved in cell wall biosynthesis
MKILMVTEDLPGGAQVGGLGKHVVTLSNAMLELGHEVAILGRADRTHAGSAAAIGFAGRLIPGFAFARPGWKEAQLGFFNPLKRPWFARRIAAAVRHHAAGYDVVHYHGHLPMVGRYLDPALNFVQTRHDQGSECLVHVRVRQAHACAELAPEACAACIHQHPGPLRRALSSSAVRRYRAETAESFARHKTIFVSSFLQHNFRRAVPDADLSRARVIHNFIRYPYLAERAVAPAQVQPGAVLLAGRLDAGKGFGEFLAQLEGWLAPPAQVTVIGDGPLRAALEARHAGQRVRFLGWRPYDEVIRTAARSHLCVVPSVLEEPCATTIVEALALGKPCLALARGGTPELAAYQYYDGQLGLADDMPQLVAMLVEQLARPPRTVPLPASFALDVFQAIPGILDVYAE